MKVNENDTVEFRSDRPGTRRSADPAYPFRRFWSSATKTGWQIKPVRTLRRPHAQTRRWGERTREPSKSALSFFKFSNRRSDHL